MRVFARVDIGLQLREFPSPSGGVVLTSAACWKLSEKRRSPKWHIVLGTNGTCRVTDSASKDPPTGLVLRKMMMEMWVSIGLMSNQAQPLSCGSRPSVLLRRNASPTSEFHHTVHTHRLVCSRHRIITARLIRMRSVLCT